MEQEAASNWSVFYCCYSLRSRKSVRAIYIEPIVKDVFLAIFGDFDDISIAPMVTTCVITEKMVTFAYFTDHTIKENI